MTFSPSKSVSALWAATGDERVRASVVAAHEAAVAAGLDYLEDNAGHGPRVPEVFDGSIATG